MIENICTLPCKLQNYSRKYYSIISITIVFIHLRANISKQAIGLNFIAVN